MNVPNFLTILRIFMIPALVVVLLTETANKEIIGFCIFIAAALTDMIDGILARRMKQVTVFGQLLDPIADKLLIASVFVCFVEMGIVPAWMVIVIIGRDIAVTGFRAIASSRGINIPADVFGKIKMNAQTYTAALLILGEKILGSFYIIARIGLWICIAAAVISAVMYTLKYSSSVLSGKASDSS